MPTRRSALKTLAGATVVGSLSGCVQLATQRTVEYNGTPAWIVQSETRGGLATAVGVEGRKTVKRAGITREIVTHNWGMLYDVRIRRQGAAGSVATFTTPSIEIAGQELNPIKDLTVGDIGNEFAKTVGPDEFHIEDPGDVEYSVELSNSENQVVRTTVEDATGRKVLRAFRDSVGGGNQNIEYTDSWTAERTIPSWDGDTYERNIRHGKADEPRRALMWFDKHDGDFVVVGLTQEKSDDRTNLASINLDSRQAGQAARGSMSIFHPTDEEFTQGMLRRHLAETNLQGMQGLVEQSRELIDETQGLVEMDEYDRQTLIRAVSGIQDTISEIREVLQGCDSDACETVLRHASDTRPPVARRARDALENGEPGTALRSLQELSGIIEEDIALLEAQESDRAKRALRLERALLEDTEQASLSAAQWQVLLRTNEDLEQLDELLGGVGEDLSSVSADTIIGGTGDDIIRRVQERSERAATIATRAHERVASHNDTRDEEDDRFVQIEDNLNGLKEATFTFKAIRIEDA